MQWENKKVNISENPPVAIIIVNYNNWADTLECLESLSQIHYPVYQIIVVDNHSTDDSIFYLTQWAVGNLCSWSPPHPPLNYLTIPPAGKPLPYQVYRWQGHPNTQEMDFQFHPDYPANPSDRPPRLVIIESDRNGGFAAGNNIGIQYAILQGTEYFLLLNNDTVVTRDFLSPLVKAAQEDKSIGIVGGKIMNYQNPQLIWAAGGGKITRWTSGTHHIGVKEMDGLKYAVRFDCDYITGCLLLIKKEVIDTIGLMKEEYFLYYEETDWNLRAKQAGYRRVYIPEAVIYHKASVSLSPLNILLTYYYTRNRIYLVKQNYRGLLKGITFCYLVGYNLIRVIFNLLMLNISKAGIVMVAFYHGWSGKMGKFSKGK
jgi:GT2 family glycosyltransferase